MANVFEFKAKIRDQFGKGHARRMRRNEQIPAVVYGAGAEPQSLELDHSVMNVALENDAVYASVLTLDVDGKKQKVVLKEVQRHVSKPKLVHLDFMRINEKETLTLSVPLHFLNEDTAKGVKAGGVISRLMNDLEIKCLPSDLPEFLELDLADVEIDQTLHISNIKLPKGVELAHAIEDEDHDHPVVSITEAKVQAEEESAAPAEAADTEKSDDKADEAKSE